MKKFILLLVACIALTACTRESSDLVPQPFVPVNIIPEIIGEGPSAPGGINDVVLNQVITNDSEWQTFLLSHQTRPSLHYFVTTIVDFTQFQVLAVYDKSRPANGFFIDIVSVVENVNEITVKVESSGTIGFLPAFTRPFQVVKIPVSTKPIVFINI